MSKVPKEITVKLNKQQSRILNGLFVSLLEGMLEDDAPIDKQKVDKIIEVADLFSDKYHEMGWCQDPDCKWNLPN